MNKYIEKLFFELISVAIGNQVYLSRTPKVKEWQELYAMAKKQSLVGVCFAGVQKLQAQRQAPNSWDNEQGELLYLQWMGMAAKIQQRNGVVNQRCVELHKRLKSDGLSYCILKGQAVANSYPENLKALRQSGDIDIWIKGDPLDVLSYVQKNWPTKHYSYVHADMNIFRDVEVEVHYRPSSLRNLVANNRFQKWAESFEHFEYHVNSGFCLPPEDFNRIYLIQHCYRHIIGAGIGLRHLMDIYFYLKSSLVHDGDVSRLKSFGLYRFASALMWVVCNVFEGSGTIKPWMVCSPNEAEGRFLLKQILDGGNFGRHIEKKF